MIAHTILSGKFQPGTYSQAFENGGFFIVLSLSATPEEVTLELGHNVVKKIEELILQTPAISPKEIVEILTSQLKNGFSFSLSVATIIGQKLHLAAAGNIQAILLRNKKIINLSSKNVTGTLLNNDLLLLATPTFITKYLPKILTLSNSPLSEITDSFLPEIELSPESANLAALLAKINLITESINTPSQPPVSNPVSSILGLVSRNHGLYLKRPLDPNNPPPSPRKILYLSLLIFVALISLIAFQLRSRTLEDRTKLVTSLEQRSKEAILSAEKLGQVNRNAAKDLLVQTKKDILSSAQSKFGPNWENEKTSQTKKTQLIINSLNIAILAISQTFQLTSLDLFYDFSLLKADPKISSASLTKNEIIALDTANNTIYSLSTKTKAAAIITGNENLKDSKSIDFSVDKIFTWSPKGIFLTNRQNSTPSTILAVKPSDNWGEIISLKSFANNLYLLDKTNNQVWKYLDTDFGFATISAYLKGSSLDFSKAADLAIDGYIYILTTTGNLARFAQGSLDDFHLTSLDEPLKNPSSLFVTDETENIYILDQTPRVVIFDKKGVYKSQYLLPETWNLKPDSSVQVDEIIKKVFLISESKVYTFDLE